ncbi:hypothetical protein CDCA_CDCA08G2525 [Cyanidium caldarium]|uniref:PDZ domain-containing protein n=1 Tax=Cyanidium caldarium TaxID=2771 RepID=A0AAV9IWK4_CYACA|nr:hypothetical protein CDCA_CDCA08G2525 [Cyanidium caldarium]
MQVRAPPHIDFDVFCGSAGERRRQMAFVVPGIHTGKPTRRSPSSAPQCCTLVRSNCHRRQHIGRRRGSPLQHPPLLLSLPSHGLMAVNSLLTAVALIFGIASAHVTFPLSTALAVEVVSPAEDAVANWALWNEAIDTIVTAYYDPTGGMHSLTREQIRRYQRAPPPGFSLATRARTYDAIRALVSELGDEYSRFLSPAEYDAELHPLRQARRLSGIGILFESPLQRLGTHRVMAPIPESPAEAAGVNPGDELVQIDEWNLEDTERIPITTDEALALLRGPPGTHVRIAVRRPRPFGIITTAAVAGQPASASNTATETVRWELTRRPLRVLPAVYTVLHSVGDRPPVGYVRVHAFNDAATQTLAEALREFAAVGVQHAVLDLRNCLGGVFQEAMVMASFFFADGQVKLVSTLDAQGNERVHRVQDQWDGWPEWALQPQQRRRSLPYAGRLAVLVNRGSASSSEVLAVALHDNQRARLIGTWTFGKGRVQRYFPLQDSSALVLTIGEYLSPQRNHIRAGQGVPADEFCAAAPTPFRTLREWDGKAEVLDSCLQRALQRLCEGST